MFAIVFRKQFMLIGILGMFVSNATRAQEPMITVHTDIKLDPSKRYSGLEILTSGITVDGNGATIEGDMQIDVPKRQGIGIKAIGVDSVTLKNIRVQGFGTGLRVENGNNWLIEDCDFSENASDPNFEWGESNMEGGIRLNRVQNSIIRKCTARKNWNNCDLFHCDGITIEDCDFSHASNLCLRMRASSNNKVFNNKLMYGIRIRPGEVHARDSSCVLIEGSCHSNHLKGNDCRFGGDGIFVRAIGSSISTDNLFEENDCSYANNNAIECGSPGNRFIRNRANHSSYGLWMGGSDRTEIIDNEVCFNGLATGFHQSPHLPNDKHAGIVFMFATAENIIIRGNRCIGNNGAGIALLNHRSSRGEQLSPSNIIIEGNQLKENAWGIFLAGTKSVRVANNLMQRNQQVDIDLHAYNDELEQVGNVDAEYRWNVSTPRPMSIAGPASIPLGESCQFRIVNSLGEELPLHDVEYIEWLINGLPVSRDSSLTYTADRPGSFSLAARAVYADNTGMTWKTVAAVEPGLENWNYVELPESWRGDSNEQLKWTFNVDQNRQLIGDSCLGIDINPYHGVRATCHCDLQPGPVSLTDRSYISFWIDAQVTAAGGWQDFNPEVVLTDEKGASVVYHPQAEILSQVPDSRLKAGWRLIRFSLAEHPGWNQTGNLPKKVAKISLGFDTWGHDPIRVWIDGLQIGNTGNSTRETVEP